LQRKIEDIFIVLELNFWLNISEKSDKIKLPFTDGARFFNSSEILITTARRSLAKRCDGKAHQIRLPTIGKQIFKLLKKFFGKFSVFNKMGITEGVPYPTRRPQKS
jgi:hypothetical protein